MSSKADETVKVVVRIRPLSSEEERDGHSVAAEAFPKQRLITVRNPRADASEAAKSFTFDSVFAADVKQIDVYNTCAASVVESVLNGYNGTIFAYGQTGAGKTHTMEGRPDPPELRGIIPNSFQHIFDFVAGAEHQQFLVRASYLEIYNDEIHDLLSKNPKNKLGLMEDVDSGVYVKDLTSFVVKNSTEIDHVMQAGKKNRSVGKTNMNEESSRSHAIFTVVIECMEDDPTGGQKIRVGKLNLVDLAGSERQGKTGATGQRFAEAKKINWSLVALGNVISALVDGKSSHIPYRDTILTRLLQNSLGGNAKTVMCANCGPADYNYSETLSTLRFANRAKNIKNKPKINEDPKDAMLREYQDEIQALKKQLEATQRGMMLDAYGKEVPHSDVRTEIVERIVEREVVKEVPVGVSEEELEKIREKAAAEKEILMKQAQQDMKALIDQQSRTEQEREDLQQAFAKESEDKRMLEEQKKSLAEKLKHMEEKLIKGGEVISKASKQEIELRKAQKELRERQMQESKLARDLAEKEEMNLQLEEHFSSLQEEVEVKTKKLKKLWSKYQGALQEAKDLQEEFQTERSDMLDTIRELSKSIKLKDLVIQNFIPDETARSIEKRAAWSNDDDVWVIPKMEFSGNKVRSNRPVSSSKLRRPESEYSRHRKQYDGNPRYKYDNIVATELDMPERTTQEFEGPDMVSRVDNILSSGINDDTDDPVSFSIVDTGPQNPYLHYTPESSESAVKLDDGKSEKSSRPKSGKRSSSSKTGSSSSSSSRPKSASKRR